MDHKCFTIFTCYDVEYAYFFAFLIQNLEYERDIKYYSTGSPYKMGNFPIKERIEFVAKYYKPPEPGLTKKIESNLTFLFENYKDYLNYYDTGDKTWLSDRRYQGPKT